MKKFQIAVTLVALLALMLTATVSAQTYTGYSWSTSYTVVNMGATDATVTVDYYGTDGTPVAAAQKNFVLKSGTSQTVVQLTDDTALGSGRYSAVISSNQPVAAVVNQQLVQDGSTSFSPAPPFSSYSGAAAGANSVTLPQVMFNWYGYNTEVIIQNVGTAAASDIKVTYTPTTIGTDVAGATGQQDVPASAVAQYASTVISQFNNTKLGAAAGTKYAGRFFGAATVTSSQAIVAVVNQHNTTVKKLMTYNGFTGGSTSVAIPQHLRGWFGYYGSLLIANPDPAQTANVTLTYSPDKSFPQMAGVNAFSVSATVPPMGSLNRWDGSTATTSQSDLVVKGYSQFIGGVSITSNIPVVVQENLETPKQAGAYNGVAVSDATSSIVVPLIQADFYGYWTTLNVQDVSGQGGTCHVVYYSDSQYSSVKNQNKQYDHTFAAAGGTFTVYENGTQGDIHRDAFWASGGQRLFIGSAVITCDHAAVAFVNEEKNTTAGDALYTFNTFNK